MKKEDADQLIRCVKECWWRVLLLLTIPLSIVAWAIYGWPITFTVEDGLASWAQAFGSVGAVIGTYLATRAQFKSELEKERRLSENIKNENIKSQDGYIKMAEHIFDWAHKYSCYKGRSGESFDLASGAQSIYDLWRVDGRIRARITLQSLKSIPLHEVEPEQRREALLHCRIKLEQLCEMIDKLSPKDEWAGKDTEDVIKDIYHLSGALHGWHDAFLAKTEG